MLRKFAVVVGIAALAVTGAQRANAAAAFGDVPFTHWADRKSTRLNSSHIQKSRMPSSA